MGMSGALLLRCGKLAHFPHQATIMKHIVDDVRIREIKELSPPGHILREYPATEAAAATTYEARAAIHRILHGADDRLLVVVGPCSIHDLDSALEYARRLKAECDRHADDLLILMRVYFEKPRTTEIGRAHV